MTFNPKDWYWRAADGRVYASNRQTVVNESDADYLAFVAARGGSGVWPADEAGNQTTAALQDVLTPYGLFADLKSYAAQVRFNKEIGGTSVSGVAYPTDRETQSKMTAAVVLSQVNPAATFKWKIADGSFVALDAAGILAVASAVGAFVQGCFATEATVVAGIDGGTISTPAAIDAAFA